MNFSSDDYLVNIKIPNPIKNIIARYRWNKYVEYFNSNIFRMRNHIEKNKNRDHVYFKWDQLVRQEIEMFIKSGKKVSREEIKWLSNRRGFDKLQSNFLINITKYVGLYKEK